MKNLLVSLFLIPVLLASSVSLTSAEDFVHHVIVLIDRSNPMDKKKPCKKCDRVEDPEKRSDVKKIMTEILDEVCFRKNDIVPSVPGRKLLDRSKGDCLSIISFGMTKQNPDFLDFIQTVKDNNGESYRYRQDYTEDIFRDDELWNATDYPEFFSFLWSAISLSMPMGIYHLREADQEVQINRTFLILITDAQYNGGGDPIQEVENMRTTAISQKHPIKNIPHAFRTYRNVQSTLMWKKVPDDKTPYERKLGKLGRQLFLKLFEFTPIAKVFAIESLIRYDNREMYFKRVHGGYQSDFSIEPISQDTPFRIRKLEARLLDDSGQVVNNNEKSFSDVDHKETIRFFLNHRYAEIKHKLKLELKFWVHWKNDVYGVHVLSPHGNDIQGAKGLTRSVRVEFEPTLKIWGIVPLDNRFYDLSTYFLRGSQLDEQSNVQMFWEAMSAVVIMLIILAPLAGFIFRFIIRVKREATAKVLNDNERPTITS